MPFKVKGDFAFDQFSAGDSLAFELHVAADESWIDHLSKIPNVHPGSTPPKTADLPQSRSVDNSASKADPANATAESTNAIRFFKFTNQLNQPVSFADFQGQGIALTFFFTRCPIPEFCPRLSRNFQAVQEKLAAMRNAPTNWHLISVSFDPRRDTPDVLKTYADSYHADPARWTFLTGPPEKIAELARVCDVKYDPDGEFFNHNFRTFILDAANRLQMVFPTTGDLSEPIVKELLKATGATNLPAAESSEGKK